MIHQTVFQESNMVHDPFFSIFSYKLELEVYSSIKRSCSNMCVFLFFYMCFEIKLKKFLATSNRFFFSLKFNDQTHFLILSFDNNTMQKIQIRLWLQQKYSIFSLPCPLDLFFFLLWFFFITLITLIVLLVKMTLFSQKREYRLSPPTSLLQWHIAYNYLVNYILCSTKDVYLNDQASVLIASLCLCVLPFVIMSK